MHYAQLELDRIKTNVRPQQLQVKPDPIQVLESAYHMTTLDAQNEVKYYFFHCEKARQREIEREIFIMLLL